MKTLWVCGACGKVGPSRATVGDESCYLNSTKCYADSIEFGPHGRAVKATAAPRGFLRRLIRAVRR